ncbi:MAG: hypothetical protein RI894_91 [Bacteroidota bacterium]|jgi:PiT family inorganic phosphate transporter
MKKVFKNLFPTSLLLALILWTMPFGFAQNTAAPAAKAAPTEQVSADSLKKTTDAATTTAVTSAPIAEVAQTPPAEDKGGLFGLGMAMSILLVLCLLLVCGFEFVNGFHDTANAVATVIYTNTLKPQTAVIWSGLLNFLGVSTSVYFFGGKVAANIINLLPIEVLTQQTVAQCLAMIFALLFSAIIWNVGTWYFGIPASSSHTLIGSILGVGLGFSYAVGKDSVNWDKAYEMGQSLLISPLAGFLATILLMLLLRWLVRTPKQKRKEQEAKIQEAIARGEMTEEEAKENEWANEASIFKGPKDGKEPPAWIRYVLMFTCSMVSFFHGLNDGQKGVGLMMLILIGIAPSYFAIKSDASMAELSKHLATTNAIIAKIDTNKVASDQRTKYTKLLTSLNATFAANQNSSQIAPEKRFELRKDIILLEKAMKKLPKAEDLGISKEEREKVEKESKKLRSLTDSAPWWVLGLISVSLGLGTMIGWRRIVVTIGEKIGKNHLSYAQGAAAEMVAATTIGIASYWGLPVSTTHVLSSGVMGSFVAQRGVRNLNRGTLTNILLAWVLTLPVTITLAAGLYLLFRAVL